MYRVAVIGDKDSIYGFAAIGMEIYPVTTAKEARDLIYKLKLEKVAIIYLTESFAEGLKDELLQITQDSLLSIVPIPGIVGNTGIGLKNVAETAKKAVGMDILF